MTTNITRLQHKSIRSAGWLYLLMSLSAPIGLIYVPTKLIEPDDAARTVEHIRASETLLRIGIGTELFHQAIAVFLVLALYRLFKPVNENQAKLLVILGALVSVPIMFVNVLNELAALILVSGADFLAPYQQSQLDALAFLSMQLHGHGIEIVSIFWGLWLFPFGVLVIQSRFIPRTLGVLLFLAGIGNLVVAVDGILLARHSEVLGQISTILTMCELPTVFWFLIKGLLPYGGSDPGVVAMETPR